MNRTSKEPQKILSVNQPVPQLSNNLSEFIVKKMTETLQYLIRLSGHRTCNDITTINRKRFYLVTKNISRRNSCNKKKQKIIIVRNLPLSLSYVGVFKGILIPVADVKGNETICKEMMSFFVI